MKSLSSTLPLVALLSVLLRARVANAQITSNASCSTDTAFLYNSRGQSPCLIAAYLGGACNGGQYDVSGLQANQHYIGPTPALVDECQCSTVMYSMMAACSVCQEASYIGWTAWAESCPQVFAEVFPRNIPGNTAVPAYAYADVVTSDNFNVQVAQSDNEPESTATVSQRTNGGGSPTNLPGNDNGNTGNGNSDDDKGAPIGAIVGGVVGGLVFIGAIGALVFFLMRRNKKNAAGTPNMMRNSMAPSTPGFMGSQNTGVTYTNGMQGGMHAPDASPLMKDEYGVQPIYSPPPQGGARLYDPNDPTTFPMSPAPPTIPSQYSGPGTGYTAPTYGSNIPTNTGSTQPGMGGYRGHAEI